MNPQHYPLQWPGGWPRTETARREQAQFRTTLPAALANLKKQIGMMGGKAVVLSSNVTLGQERPADCGVVAYFVWNGKPLAVPCDRWLKVEHNIQAIALTIEAMRGMERWGAKHMIEAMFTGFKALPSGPSQRHWTEVLGVSPGESIENISTAYRALAKKCHPDVGGDRQLWDELEAAWVTVKKERGVVA